MFKCDNCGFQNEERFFPPAKDLLQRLDIGGIFTNKECPKCGALAYPVQTEKRSRVLITMEGGLITDVSSDTPLKIMRIDYDVEGAEDENKTPIKDIEGNENEAFVSIYDAELCPKEFMDHFFKQVEERE